MTEDKFDEFIRDAARDYNRPPEIAPREEMWARIQESQRASVATPMLRVERGAGNAERSFPPRKQWWALAAAAGILLVAGVSIGRLTSPKTPTVAVAQEPAKTVAATSIESPEPQTAAVADASSTEAPDRAPVGISERVGSGPSRSVSAPRRGRTTLEIDASRMSATYQLASLQHLAETEALLTAFRTDSANRAMDPVVAKWSRDLLSNTRLLLDSPAARDPLRKHLLEDLELVLTQIVQLSNTPNANDRDMVESTIREGHVMTRLRTAIPAGRPQGS